MAAVGFSFPTIDARSSPIFQINKATAYQCELVLLGTPTLSYKEAC